MLSPLERPAAESTALEVTKHSPEDHSRHCSQEKVMKLFSLSIKMGHINQDLSHLIPLLDRHKGLSGTVMRWKERGNVILREKMSCCHFYFNSFNKMKLRLDQLSFIE